MRKYIITRIYNNGDVKRISFKNERVAILRYMRHIINNKVNESCISIHLVDINENNIYDGYTNSWISLTEYYDINNI